jgi:photosystem II stability/assembly factor-like uncharacterized protein
MLNHTKAGILHRVLAMAVLVAPGIAQAATTAWERPAPMSKRAEQAVLLHVAAAGKRLVAVGERGLVLRSDDGGRHWTQSPVPVSVTLTRAYFVSAQTGWATGHSGVVLRTDDGGHSWTRQLNGVQAAGLAVNKYTEDSPDPAIRAQAAAARQLEQDGADKPFFDILFTDDRTGFAIGAYGLAFRTEDGGAHWVPWMEHLDNPQGLHLYGMAKSGNSLFIAGEQGLLLQSTDGGKRFRSVRTPYKGSWFGIVPLPRGDLYLYGLRGNLYRSGDDGTSWTKIDAPSQASFSAGLALSDTEALFANQAGQAYTIRHDSTDLLAMSAIANAPYTSIARLADGTWITASMRGIARIEAGNSATGRPRTTLPSARETSK